MNDNTKTSTFFLNLNNVTEQAIESARIEYRENADKLYAYDDEEAYINDIKWQEKRIERLGEVQASMKSAQSRQVWIFSGYVYPERLVPEYGIPGNPLVAYECGLAVWDWKSLVADDYLKQ